MTENLEKIAESVDTLENLIASLSMTNLPDRIHVEALREALPELKENIKGAIIKETGENPWE